MIFKRLANNGLWGLMSAALSLLIVVMVVYAYMYLHLPNVSGLKDVKLQAPLRVLSTDGQLIAEFGTKRRIPIQIADVPKPLILALLSTEDQRFYQHEGVDFRGVARAAVAVITSGRKVQGASTITMQVARNFFLSRKKSYARKINEILLAIKIEHTLTKDEILQLYLNKVFFGNRAYGIAAAAQVYYGKSMSQLTLVQMAMLAGLPQAPSRNNPLNNPKQALLRRNHVLERMLELKEIDRSTYQMAITEPVTARFHEQKKAVSAPYVAEMVRQAVIKHFGEDAVQQGLTVTTTISPSLQRQAQRSLQQGLIAYSIRHGYVGAEQHWYDTPSDATTAEWVSRLQKIPTIASLVPAVIYSVKDKTLVALLANGQQVNLSWEDIRWARRRKTNNILGPVPSEAADIAHVGDVVRLRLLSKGHYALGQVPAVQGAIISTIPKTGAVQSLVGGLSFKVSHFNRVIQARRQAGSIFKPYIYSAALNYGYTLASVINDAPIVMQDSGENELWRPNNDNFSFRGPTRLLTGLNQSRNLVSIRLLQSIGIPYALNFIKRFGFDENELPDSLSLALGSASVSPAQIAQGFGVFANGGYLVAPFVIRQVTDANGKLIYVHKKSSIAMQAINNSSSQLLPAMDTTSSEQPVSVIPADNAYLMTTALRSVIQYGTGRAARVLKRADLAGKTGTTNNKVDAWFAGFNPKLCSVVWVGFDDQQTLREFGAQAALPIWIDFMRQALKGAEIIPWVQPSGLVTVKIDPKSGLLARPGQSNAIFQIFRRSFVPSRQAADISAYIDGASKSLSSTVASSEDQLF